MSSAGNPQALAADPENDLLWRFDMRRLAAEEMRDAMLASTGSLNLQMFGPGVYPEDVGRSAAHANRSRATAGSESPPEEQNRRSIYIHIKRSLVLPILAEFDVCDTDSSCAVRFATTQPTQALAMLNGDFAHEQAAALGATREARSARRTRPTGSAGLASGAGPACRSRQIEQGLPVDRAFAIASTACRPTRPLNISA